MILTCYRCPSQLSFAGRIRRLARFVAAFGWSRFRGGYCCGRCAGKG